MTAERLVMLLMGTLVLVGTVVGIPFLLYLVAAMAIFAGVTGICPGAVIFKKLGVKSCGAFENSCSIDKK